MGHLAEGVGAGDDVVGFGGPGQGAGAVDGAAEVEAGDVDAGVLDFGCAGGGGGYSESC